MHVAVIVTLLAIVAAAFIAVAVDCPDIGYGCSAGHACRPHWECNNAPDINSKECCP